MKTYNATLGLISWITETRKNPACIGDGDPSLVDVAELCFAFTVPIDELEKMTDEEIRQGARGLMRNIEADDFHALQQHAQSEIKRFYDAAYVPKKPTPRRGILARIAALAGLRG